MNSIVHKLFLLMDNGSELYIMYVSLTYFQYHCYTGILAAGWTFSLTDTI